MMEEKCAVCQTNSSLKCSKCHTVFYCSKEHQKEDWKKHKNQCKPLFVKEDKILGRHLVASKDIKEGEIIFKEKPLVIGPAQITPPVCLGCYKELEEKKCFPCGKCGWPVCNTICADSPNHKPECELIAAQGKKVNIQTFGCVHPNYQSIMVVRSLFLKKSRPDVWKRLISLQSHSQFEKQKSKWHDHHLQIAQFARKFFGLENEFTEEEVMQVCGIVQINGHEVPFTEPPFVAIYDTTSMLEHNCKANCAKSFTDHGEALIAAAVDIKAGEHLSICYTDPMWGTTNRLHHLEETKFFKCKCQRCTDVTELGTMFSALKCQKQGCPGYALPKSFISDEVNNDVEELELPDWTCNACSETTSGKAAQKLIEHVGTDLEAMEKGHVESCIRFLEHYGKFLHPQHYYMMDVTLALAQIIGQDGNGLADVTEDKLNLKLDLCRKMSDLLDKLVPAEIRARGMLLFELHAAIAEMGKRRATEMGEGPSILIYHLTEAKKFLEKSIELLQNEAKTQQEGRVHGQAIKNLAEMDTLLQKLYSSINAPLL